MAATSTIVQYVGWLRSVFRRIREDISAQRLWREWWARGVSISPMALIRTGKHYCLEIGPGSLIGPYTILDLQNDPLDLVPGKGERLLAHDCTT